MIQMQGCSDGRAASSLQTGDGKREVQANKEDGPLKNGNGRGELSLKAGSNSEKEVNHRKQRETELLQKTGEARLESHQRAGWQEVKDDQVLKVERVVKVVLEAVEKTVEEIVEKIEARRVLERLELVWEDMRMRVKLEGRVEGVEERYNSGRSAGPPATPVEHLERARSPQRSTLSPSTQELWQAFREVFDILSEGAGGSIDYQRFQSLLKAEGFKANETEAQRAFRQLDQNGDGKVGFKDFWQTMSNTSLFLKFLEELPNACPACQLQKGYVNNGVVFEILLKLLTNRVISEESIRSIIHYYYRRMQKLEVKAKDSLRLKAGNALPRLSLELVGVEQPGEHRDLKTKHLMGFYEAFQMLVGDHTGHILASDILSVMYQMGIPLKNPLIPDDLKFVDFREMDFKVFLFTVTDFGTITSFLDPHCMGCKATRSPEVLPFQLLLKLLQTPLVEAQCRAIVTGYFQEKFRASLPPRQSRERGVLIPGPDGGSSTTVGAHR